MQFCKVKIFLNVNCILSESKILQKECNLHKKISNIVYNFFSKGGNKEKVKCHRSVITKMFQK